MFEVNNLFKFYQNYINFAGAENYRLLFLIGFSIIFIPICQCGFVAYSTSIEGQNLSYYSYPLDSFREIWLYMFLWAFFSISLVHLLAAAIALLTLRKHKYGRYFSILIILFGTISALFICSFTSAAVAYVLYQAKIQVLLIHAMLCGFSQLGIFLFVTFFTLKPTL